MIKQKLQNIANIQFGLYEKPHHTGSIKYLHAGHFDKLYNPTEFKDSYVELDGKNDKFLLKPNDLILAGKGHRIFAWPYDPNFGEAIPSSLFYIIRPNTDYVLGEYLAYYLNSEKIQYELKLIGAGATITSIPKKELGQITINLPPIKKQQEIIELIRVLDENIELTKDLLEKRTTLKRGLVNRIMNQEIK
nr:restriction endonuclease subunit S [Allomuricauda sp.]